MPTWTSLAEDLAHLDLSGERGGAERAAFEEWARKAEEEVMVGLRRAALSRAKDLFHATGANIEVTVGAGGAPTPSSGPRFRTVSLRLGPSAVHIYSTRARGESPAINLAVTRGATSTRAAVLPALPGCLVVRGRDGAPALVRTPVILSERSPELTTIDALVLRAFELLVSARASARFLEERPMDKRVEFSGSRGAG